MRTGFATSLVAHTVLITLGVVGLHGAEELKPMAVEAISVDLVPIEDIASIRTGSERSSVIETPAPAAVDTPTPVKLAERSGATEKDQPKPEETVRESPAPTVATAPEPAPEPVEVEKAAENPVLAAEPTTETPTDQPVPMPAMRTASIEIKRAERKPAPQQDTKPADKVAEIINTEPSRGTVTGSGGEAAAGKPTGQAARLSQSELGALEEQMRRCWNPTLAERNDGIVIRLMVHMNENGTVNGMPDILTDLTASPLLGVSARTAARKVLNCGPFDLPPDKYDHWREIDVTLDASQTD